MYIQVRRRRLLNGYAKEVKDGIKWAVRAECPHMMFVPIEIKIRIHKNWWCKNGNPKQQDVSNLIKAIEDAVCAGLQTDDRYVWKITAQKAHSKSKEGIEVAWKKL
jgi:Holliday junction resolvase RusA-like endonuclease